MIRINLLRAIDQKEARRRPLSRGVVAAAVVVAAGLAGAGAFVGWSRLHTARQVAPLPAPTPPPPQAAAPTKSDFEPSTFAKSKNTEDVVRDVKEPPEKLEETGMLNLPYEQFSMGEKINFEELFAKTVCEMLARTVPEQIGLSKLELTNFQSIYAVGVGSSRDLVNELFSSVKKEKVTLLAPPYSFIKPNREGGFRFAFSCTPQWGINMTDPFVDVSLGSLPGRDGLPLLVKKLSKIAGENGVVLRGEIKQVSSAKVDRWRRFSYHLAGASSFVNLVRFLKGMYDGRIPCAFQKLALTAADRSQVSIDAVVVLTTGE